MTRRPPALVRGLLVGLVTFGLPGCYISQQAFENALCRLDEDGDGDPRCGLSNTPSDGDCDDSNPYMSNLREETGTGELDDRGEDSGGAYDGLDNDCEGGDLLDVDGDGYPGISREEYEAKGGTWPEGLSEEVDCADLPIEGQPEGFEATVNPGASEIYYDGIDGNCDGLDDFDQDKDGFASAAHAEEYAAYGGELDATDCNDTDPAINPDVPAEDEVYYDGEDQDCNGENDFDPDGDGYLSDGYNDDATVFATRYDYELSWVPDADCMDLYDTFDPDSSDPDRSVEANAATTYVRTAPDAEECAGVAEGFSCEQAWYDGIDDSCDELDSRGRVIRNDWDQDQDGFVRSEPGDREAFIAYILAYAAFTKYDVEAPYQPYRQAMIDTYGDGAGNIDEVSVGAWFDANSNDCVDTDATINPDALEILGDGVDQDCDGDGDTARFAFGDLTFEGPGGVRMATTDQHHVMVVSATESVDLADGFGAKLPRVVALSWELDAASTDDTSIDGTPYAVTKSTDDLHLPVHLYASGGTYFTGVSWASTRTRLQFQVSSGSVGTNYQVLRAGTPSTRTDVTTYTDGDLRCEASGDACWQVSCDGSSVHWASFRNGATVQALQSGILAAVDAEECFVLPDRLSGDVTRVYTKATDGTFTSWEEEFGVLVPSIDDPLAGETATFVRSHQDWLILGQAGGGLRFIAEPETTATVLTDQTYIDADATVIDLDGSDWWAIVGIRTSGELELAYGPADSLTRVILPVDSEAGVVDPTSVAVSADDNRVVIGVRGSDGAERIGWTLLATP